MRAYTALSSFPRAIAGVSCLKGALLTTCSLTVASLLAGCSSDSRAQATPTDGNLATGQSDFVSAKPGGSSRGLTSGDGAEMSASPPVASGAGAKSNGATGSSATPAANRQVEETDLYRFDAATNRLYYLNSYRGLLVFDVSNVDSPVLLGRAPIFGSPVEMVVRGNVVAVVIGDWYGTDDQGKPFHGSVVHGFDATTPSNIVSIGEARLGGWVRDSRIVGDPASPSAVLYTVSEDYGWTYGWADGLMATSGIGTSAATGPAVVVSSVSFGPTGVQLINEKRYGKSTDNCYYYSGGGIFNVTNQSILLAKNHIEGSGDAGTCSTPRRTDLLYLDISDAAGSIRERGASTVDGLAQGWGADNGRWNLDFADKVHAHVVGCAAATGYCGGNEGYVLSTVDFTNPDAPALASTLNVPSPGWTVTARFDGTRAYLSPQEGYYRLADQRATPVQIYDLANPAAPRLAGQTQIPGSVWLFMPSGNQLFALGSQETQSSSSTGYDTYGSKVSLSYLDVTDASQPRVVGTASFGDGWAWTPASGTFKAFTKDESKGLVVLPFNSWSSSTSQYIDGVQLIEFVPPSAGAAGSISTSGTGRTKGWVERGIFVKDRLLSLSDVSLAVIDYSNRTNPVTVKEITLARNVVDATPQGTTLAELSTDWWGNDTTKSLIRVRPIADPEENMLGAAMGELEIEGSAARVYHNADGTLAYVVSNVQRPVPCSVDKQAPTPKEATNGASDPTTCRAYTQKVTVVDQTQSTPVVRGVVELPVSADWYGYIYDGWGWYGWSYGDWFDGNSVVQVGDHTLAFRRWSWASTYEAAVHSLHVVDLTNPAAPTIASTTITQDATAWWGNMRAAGNTLYATHYEWYTEPSAAVDTGEAGVTETARGEVQQVKYYLDRIDLSNPTHPAVASRINVPGVFVGSKTSDPSILFTIDYHWDPASRSTVGQLAAVRIDGDRAYLVGALPLNGWPGKVVVQNDVAYMSIQRSECDAAGANCRSRVELHEIDLSDPSHPVDRASEARDGWGWLLDVVGDRAFVRSGWGDAGFDMYKLSPGTPPEFERFVRTRGWSAASLKRDGNTVYLSTGYWGVQAIHLQ